MRSERYPSLELVFRELKALLDRQSAHVDALDSKASIVIGFTALVLGVAVGGRGPSGDLATVGVSLGGLSFLAALTAFWARSFASFPRPREFYEQFVTAEEEQSRVILCNLAVAAFERNAPTLRRKVVALKLSLVLLVGAVGAFVLAFFLEGATLT